MATDDDDGIEDGVHQDERPDDRNVDHVREDQSQVGQQDGKSRMILFGI